MTVTTAVNSSNKITVLNHPLVNQHLATIRDKATPSQIFRGSIGRLTEHLLLEATIDLPQVSVEIETPVAKTSAQNLDKNCKLLLCPILRAGLVMADVAFEMLPMASVYHIGLKRDEETHQAIAYYRNLPDKVDGQNTRVFLLDPMLATGGSAVSAIEMLKEVGVPENRISLLCIIASPEGAKYLAEKTPGVSLYTAALDERLNDKAYIVPGLGDAGDRSFGTL